MDGRGSHCAVDHCKSDHAVAAAEYMMEEEVSSDAAGDMDVSHQHETTLTKAIAKATTKESNCRRTRRPPILLLFDDRALIRCNNDE